MQIKLTSLDEEGMKNIACDLKSISFEGPPRRSEITRLFVLQD
jgi:hypothetical protein